AGAAPVSVHDLVAMRREMVAGQLFAEDAGLAALWHLQGTSDGIVAYGGAKPKRLEGATGCGRWGGDRRCRTVRYHARDGRAHTGAHRPSFCSPRLAAVRP